MCSLEARPGPSARRLLSSILKSSGSRCAKAQNPAAPSSGYCRFAIGINRVEHAPLFAARRSGELAKGRYQRFCHAPLLVGYVAGICLLFHRLPILRSISEKVLARCIKPKNFRFHDSLDSLKRWRKIIVQINPVTR